MHRHIRNWLMSLALLCVLGLTHANAYTHPGAPLTLSDLQTLKANVDQGKEPWKSGYAAMAGDSHSSLGYTMQGPHANVSRSPNVNLWPWRNDMMAIWNLSRMWYFTGNEAYAQKAHDILLAWATTQTSFTGSESMLDLGDYAYKFVGGAEILRGTWPGWTEADTTAVKAYFGNVLMPASNPYGESMYGAANKGALALVSLGLLAIFNDDTAKLDQVVYQVRSLAHIGLRSSDDIGLLGDSLRDQGHAHGQLFSLAMLAEALWKQGIDVYSENNNRLLAAGEYFARINTLTPTPFLPFGTTDNYYIADNTGHGWGGGHAALNLIHGAYAVRQGLQAPYTDRRRQEIPVDGDSFMFLKEVDTSTATPAAALPIPATTSITSGFTDVEIGGASPTGGASYSGGTWTVQGGGSEMWGTTNDSCHFTYQALTGDCAIIAKVESIGPTADAAKAGVMMRTSLDQGAPRAWMAVTRRVQFEQNIQGLAVYGGTNYSNRAYNIPGPTASYWVKLERIGNIITGYVSPDGTNWAATDVGRFNGTPPDTIYVGLVVCSITNGTLNTSTFSNVQITGGDGGAPVVTPAAPAALLAAPGENAVPLRWQPSFGATSYTVKRATSSGGAYATIASDITASNYTDTTVTSGTTYYYVVTASNSAGTSGNSPEDSATPIIPMVNVAFGGTANDNFNNSNGGNGAAKAFDRNPGSKWLSSAASWLQYDFGFGYQQVVKRYTITSASDLPERDPKNWNLLASQDGLSWTTLDSRVDQTFAKRYQVNTYSIANPGAYRYYRLEVTANNGDASTQLSEFGLWSDTVRTLSEPLPLAVSPDNGQLVLTWAAISTSTYTVKRSTTSGGPYTTIATGLTDTTYTDTGLTNGVTYYYVVSNANSLDSAEVAAAPSPLRVHLKFDETGGGTAFDASSHARHAALVNGPVFGTGNLGNALNFTATSSQHAILPSGVVSDLTDFTISTWIKVNSFASWQRIFDFGTGTNNYMYLTTQYTTTAPNASKLRLGIRTPSAAEQTVSGTGIALSAGVWTHVAVTRSGNTLSLYVNGSLAGSGTITISPADLGITSQNYLGKSQWNDPYLNAALDDFRIYNQAFSASEISALTTVPSAPSGLAATAVNEQVSLSWDAVSSAMDYNVKRSTTSGGPYTTLQTGVATTNFTDASTISGTTYYYVVSATNLGGEGANSAEVSATTAPAAPTGLVTTPGSGQVELSWDASTGASSYTILRATSPNGPFTTLATGVTGTSYADTTALPGWTYYYAVSAGNGAGESQASASATTTAAAVAVSWLKLDETSGTTAADASGNTNSGTLVNSPTWIGGKAGNALGLNGTNQYATLPNSVTSNLHDFTVSTWVYWNGGGNWQRIFDFGSGISTNMFLTPKNGANGKLRFAITTSGGGGEQKIDGNAVLPSGGWHHVAVTLSGTTGRLYVNGQQVGQNTGMTLRPSDLGATTQNRIGRSQYNDPYLGGRVDDFRLYAGALSAAEIAGLAAPIQTTGLAATGGIQQVALTWNATTGATSYTVRRASTTGGAYTTVASDLTGTSYTDTGLADATTYYYVVTPANASGDGANSAEASATTVPAAPGNVTVTAGDGQATLNWSASTGATGYNVLRATSPNGSYTTVASGLTGTSYLDTGLTNGTTYYYAVVATNGSGSSANSTQVSAITAPAAPSGLTATPDNGQVSLLWNPSTGAATYDVLRSATSGSGYATVATGLTSTSYTDTGLTNDTTYYYVVTATNTGGTSANSTEANATPVALPSPWATSDIGSTGATGNASRSPSGIFTVTGAGADIWDNADAFRYVYQTATGDCDITVRVTAIGNTNAWAKGGVMIRETLAAGSRHAMTVVTPGSGVSFQRRTSTNGISAHTTTSGLAAPYWVRLTRVGDVFTAYRSADGTNWTNMGSATIAMSTSVYIGLPVTSHVSGTLCTATLDNVTVTP